MAAKRQRFIIEQQLNQSHQLYQKATVRQQAGEMSGLEQSPIALMQQQLRLQEKNIDKHYRHLQHQAQALLNLNEEIILKEERTSVAYSPYSGVVIEKSITEGSSVKKGMEVYKLADLSSLWIVAKAYESDRAYIQKGYTVEYGGQFKSAEASSNMLIILGVIVIFGVFILLYMAFASIRDALLILLNLPFAMIRGVVGLYMAGGILSVATIIGFITLLGIATRNGVIMIAHIHNLMQHEQVSNFEQAVKQGAKERLVPILMTAISAGLAMVPLALGVGEAGSEIQAPMAMVILFGLLSSTLLNMVILPALYLRFGLLKK
ncbi:MAG: Cobalt-zinc-cadmium resistance protein CzcA; Cation efflux system protein CusA [uncultured Sulfurovum sp.]|uniref:Cobalt-zinc-cadmium resistance protein CzcA Cation efflux system protein CusA n=1 Tax=uncultured Sulfurovum sp. TaxID=269237 RepID=A0A6S6UGK4_9BACT|nr:MAG: Cobalt-zinc-cadmium resistance protein CzcA; Cation efflux system protein CusA [uncultured Sulfurovum sp.]